MRPRHAAPALCPRRVPVLAAWLVAALLPVVLALVPVRLGAQIADVRLREGTSAAPLSGAIVRLVNDTGAVVVEALTNDEGRVTLRAPGPGVYRLRVNRIGFQPMTTEPFRLEPLERLSRDLTMSSVRLTLPPVVVQDDDRCEERMREGSLAATLWEEIRTALTANLLTYRQRTVPLQVTQFRRTVTLRGETEGEWVTGSRVAHGPPFGAVPVSVLVTHGFVFETGDGETMFAAPDAALLLSREFVTTHCFGAVAGAEGLVGLHFRPARDRRLPDVRGTLWVDRATVELRSIDYEYVNLPSEMRRAELGGRLEFRRLPGGAWIVSYWHIRMPRLEQRAGEHQVGGANLPRTTRRAEIRVAGYVEEGGRVALTTEAAPQRHRANVVGLVWDSTAAAPLSGAVIRVQGEPDSVASGADGRFVLAVATGGPRTVTVSHPKLGLLDGGTTRDVVLAVGSTATIDFAVPSIATFTRELCGSARNRSGVVGVAYDHTGVPAEGLPLRAIFAPTAEALREVRAESGENGLFAFCDLPARTAVTIQLGVRSGAAARITVGGGQVLAQEDVNLDPSTFRWVELRP